MKVSVMPYNPQWAHDFQTIKTELEDTLVDTAYIAIEHIGSTSVPGLAAKPIIDIDIIVTSSQLDLVRQVLVDKGKYVDMDDMGVPERYAFRSDGVLPARNLYVCIKGSQSLQNHLTVRDMCRNDPLVRHAYGQKKLELANHDWEDVDEYCEAKNDVLAWILTKAGWSIVDTNNIRDVNATRAPIDCSEASSGFDSWKSQST